MCMPLRSRSLDQPAPFFQRATHRSLELGGVQSINEDRMSNHRIRIAHSQIVAETREAKLFISRPCDIPAFDGCFLKQFTTLCGVVLEQQHFGLQATKLLVLLL